jgi:NADPH:quinone reductase-like Zn-dependent oxidoreductase
MIRKPAIPETDVSGTIIAVGKDEQLWKEGDQVFGIVPASDMYRCHQGALREYTLLKPDNMHHP